MRPSGAERTWPWSELPGAPPNPAEPRPFGVRDEPWATPAWLGAAVRLAKASAWSWPFLKATGKRSGPWLRCHTTLRGALRHRWRPERPRLPGRRVPRPPILPDNGSSASWRMMDGAALGADPEPRRHRHWERSGRSRACRCAPADRGERAGLRYLPPYSPDLNPVDQAFAKPKTTCGKRRLEPETTCGTPSAAPSTPRDPEPAPPSSMEPWFNIVGTGPGVPDSPFARCGRVPLGGALPGGFRTTPAASLRSVLSLSQPRPFA
jgi:hypothetical protein